LARECSSQHTTLEMTYNGEMASSLAVIKAAGAASLDLQLVGLTPVQGSVTAMSPWAGSMTDCSSPWSPVTPAVGYSSTVVPMSPVFFPGPHQGVPARLEARDQPMPVRSITTTMQHSPTPNFGNVAMSPGAEIRRNAADFGIPLNLHTQTFQGEVIPPVPVRGPGGGVVVPSPTTRRPMDVSMTPAVTPTGFVQPAVHALPVTTSMGTAVPMMAYPNGVGSTFPPPPLISMIVTPLTASRARRAEGGA